MGRPNSTVLIFMTDNVCHTYILGEDGFPFYLPKSMAKKKNGLRVRLEKLNMLVKRMYK